MEEEEARRILWRTTIVLIKTKNQIQNAKEQNLPERASWGKSWGSSGDGELGNSWNHHHGENNTNYSSNNANYRNGGGTNGNTFFTTVVLVVKQTRQMTGDDAITIKVRTKTTIT